MTLFDGVYPFYPQQRKAAWFDIGTITVTVVFLTLACSFLLIAPGIRGRARLFWTLRVLLSLFVGAVIVVVQFTGDWESGWVRANTSYKSFSPVQVSADIGLHVGLAGLNVTLRGNPVEQINETINYNEHFPWSFGADYDHSYSQGLQKGLPSPILYVAEKFSSQSPCAWHRRYRIAGHYASAMLCALGAQIAPTTWKPSHRASQSRALTPLISWAPHHSPLALRVAFCTWVMSNILLSMPALVYGGYMLLATGASMIFSLLSFSTVRNSPTCLIQIGTSTLHVAYGGSFWLMLAIGLLCLVAGITIVAMHHLRLDLLKTFFDLHEDKAEEHQEMPEVFSNHHFVSKSLPPSEPTEINSI